MKTVILAGGLGTRLGELTHSIPKPMVRIGDKPILWHIMQIYSRYGFKEFFIALGYKGEIIKEYFENYGCRFHDIRIDLKNNEISYFNKDRREDWIVNLIDTGEHTMTGGRLKRLRKYVKDDPYFFATYGDGVSDIDIQQLLEFHKSHKKLATMTLIEPIERFGIANVTAEGMITGFQEKKQQQKNWINGGFFVLSPNVLDYIKNVSTSFEQKILHRLATEGQLMGYRHRGFWKCMDTFKDFTNLNEMVNHHNIPWIK